MTTDFRTADVLTDAGTGGLTKPGAAADGAGVPATATPIGPIRHSLDDNAERAPVFALIVFLAVLPLEWITLAGGTATEEGGGNIKPFHVAAAIFAILCFLRWRPRAMLAPVWNRHLGVYAAYFVVLAVGLAASFAFPDPYLMPILVLRQLSYSSASLFIAGFLVLIIGHSVQRWLAASGVIASGLLMLAFVYALASQGSNPITILGSAISQGDPDIITFQLLRTTFRTDDDLAEVAANLRHKVFIGLLIGVFFGLACMAIIDRKHRFIRGLLLVGSGVGFVLVLLSLSRSTTLCMAVPFMLYPLRVLVRNRAKPVEAVGMILAVASGVAVLISPIGALLYARFSATGSYTSRLTAAGPSFLEDFLPSALIGATKGDVEKSPHNFILNAWLGGGLVAGAAATLMFFWMMYIWLREFRRYIFDVPGWVIPVGQIWFLGIGVIPLVRAFTAGNQFHMVEFTAIALFLGLTLANERAAAAAKLPSATGGVPVPSRRPTT